MDLVQSGGDKETKKTRGVSISRKDCRDNEIWKYSNRQNKDWYQINFWYTSKILFKKW